jgi:hypothetical protein
MILTDTFIVERAEIITENRGGKMVPILKGVFGRCDEKNNNGRVYSKPLLEREVKRIAEAMTERRLLGELDHPSHDSVKLSNVSHLITNLSFNNNELVGECELLNTPSGKVAQALVEGGVKVGISSRGMGTLSEQADGSKHVNEDFKLVTFDLVADPSTRGAFPGMSESTQSSLVEEIVSDTLENAAREKVFTTLLKDKLREKAAEFGTQKPGSMAKGTPDIIKKDKRKPTSEDPFRNWEDLYGAYTGKPRLVKTRGYEDAEKVTEPQEVVDHNIYCQLKDVILESQGAPVLRLEKLVEALREGIVSSLGKGFLSSNRKVRRVSAMRQKVGELLRKGAEQTSKRSVEYTSDSPVRRTAQYRSDGKQFVQRFKPDADKAGTATSMVKRRDTEYKKKTLPDREAAAANRDRDIDAPMSGPKKTSSKIKAVKAGQKRGTPEQQVRRGLKPKISSTTSDYRTAAAKATDALNR